MRTPPNTDRRNKPQPKRGQRQRATSGLRAAPTAFVAALAEELHAALADPGIAGTVTTAALMTIITWPAVELAPLAGLDSSWHAGLVMALRQHLAWGPRIDFTYGPLGFLVIPNLYYGITSFLSICFLLLTRCLFFVLLLRASYSTFSPYLALAFTLLVGATATTLVAFADLLMPIEFLLAVEAFRSQPSPRRDTNIIALSAFVGFGLLVKFSIGLLGIGLLIVVVGESAIQWKRSLVMATGSFVAALLVGWVATGNSLSNLFQYLHMSEAVAAGYSGAMSYEVGSRIDEWYYAAIILGCLALCAFWALRELGRRRQLCIALALLGYSWVALKEGFVRHDTHDLEFFSFMLVAFLALPWQKPRMPTARLAGALGLTTVLAWTAAGSVPSNISSFSYDTHQLASSLFTVLAPTKRDRTIAQARSSLQATYQIPRSFLTQIHNQTVAIEPYENTVAWAYHGFTWDPEPVLQQYTAYRSSLDNLDARFLRSSHAPTRILAEPEGIYHAINQDPYFNAPTADVDLLCRYAQAGATTTWQLLVRVQNRCGRLLPLETIQVRFGQTISVPRAPMGDAIVATFHGVGTSLLYRLENLVLKARAIDMKVPGASWRFVAATSGDLHIMRAPSTLGYNDSYAPPIISSFALYERNLLSDGGRYQVTFYTMKIKALPTGR